MYDLIIIGGGPAGIAAGIYGARKKLKTLLLSKDFFGQVGKSFLVENYPGFKKISGQDLMRKFRDHLKKFEIEIKEKGVREVQKSKDGFIIDIENKESFTAKAVIIASGRDPRPLEIPREKTFIGKGISYCPTCDLPFFEKKDIAIIGGGNSGFETAIEAVKYCPKIYILEAGEKLLADETLQERARKAKKIEVILNAKVKKILGQNWLEGLIYQDLKEKKDKELKIKGVFIQIGYVPTTSFVKDLVDFNERDEIIIEPKTCQTKTPGLFAAGDVTDVKYKQIVIAAGEGTKAALSAYEYVQKLAD